MDCRGIEFSPEKSQERITSALRVFNPGVLNKILAFSIYLLNDYFSSVPDSIWEQFVATVSLKYEIIADLIERENGPRRKEKAELALTAFKISLNRRMELDQRAAA